MRKRKKWHDLNFKDISKQDLELIRCGAIQAFTNTPECNHVPLVVNEFIAYLQGKGYKIKRTTRIDEDIRIKPGKMRVVNGHEITNKGRVAVYIDKCLNARTLCAQRVHLEIMELK